MRSALKSSSSEDSSTQKSFEIAQRLPKMPELSPLAARRRELLEFFALRRQVRAAFTAVAQARCTPQPQCIKLTDQHGAAGIFLPFFPLAKLQDRNTTLSAPWKRNKAPFSKADSGWDAGLMFLQRNRQLHFLFRARR